MTGVASEAASAVGLWWPAADEQHLRDAADVWHRLADAVDAASGTGRDASARATTAWSGDAAGASADAWRRQEESLATQATDARQVATALQGYADAVEDAKHRVEDLAVTAGCVLLAGGIAAFVTAGITEAAAAAVTTELVSAAAAVGVELSGTVAAITGGALTTATFGAAESAAGDVVAQGIRTGLLDRGEFSVAELGDFAASGAALGGVGGGLAGGVAVGPVARAAAGDLSGLRVPGGRIRAALDPPNWGAQGGRFSPGVHELPGARTFQPHELPTAELLASEGKSVHARAEVNAPGTKNPDALVRAKGSDPGTYTEFKRPTENTAAAVKNDIMKAAKQLKDYGNGDLIVDGRSVGLTREVGENALRRALGQARNHGSALPDKIRIVLDDGSSITYP